MIVDSPPLNFVTDAALSGVKAGGIVIVGRANHTERAAVQFAVERLKAVRAPVFGFVLNDFVFQRDYRTGGGVGYDCFKWRGAAYAERYGESGNGDGDSTGWRSRVKAPFRG